MKSEPTRLIDADPEFARLVAASEDDVPSPAQVDEAVSLARSMVSASASRWRLFRLFGSATVIVGVSVIGLLATTSTSNTTPNPVQQTEVAAAPTPVAPVTSVVPVPAAEAVVPAVAEPPTPKPSDVRPVAPRGRTTTVNPGASSARAESSTFDEELALLSAARSGLETKDTSACLRAIERYETRFRAGVFAEEMEVLRIEALASSGDRSRAHTLAERFLEKSPGSAYAARVRSLAERTRD